MPDDTPLGTEIKKRLSSDGLTQTAACEGTVVSPQSLSAIIKGETELSDKYLNFLVETLGENREYWLTYYPNKVNGSKEALVSGDEPDRREQQLRRSAPKLHYDFKKGVLSWDEDVSPEKWMAAIEKLEARDANGTPSSPELST